MSLKYYCKYCEYSSSTNAVVNHILTSHTNKIDKLFISKGVNGIAAIYNSIAKNTTTDFILIYHADMIAGKDMDLNLYKQLYGNI